MEKQLFEKNRIIGILATQLIVNSQDISKKKKKKKKSRQKIIERNRINK